MKPYLRIIVLASIYLLYCIASFAQIKDSFDYRGSSEIAINTGILSTDQVNAIFSEGGTYSGLKEMPSMMTGAAFISYHYYLSNRFAVGLAAGLDNQKGDLSFGNSKMSLYSNRADPSGSYKRNIYTTAVEALFIYERYAHNIFYCLVGAGYTFGSVNYSFNEEGQKFYAPYKYPYQSEVPPYAKHISHFNAQITPFGYRCLTPSRKFYISIELGYGYKGLVCVGCGMRLGKTKYISI